MREARVPARRSLGRRRLGAGPEMVELGRARGWGWRKDWRCVHVLEGAGRHLRVAGERPAGLVRRVRRFMALYPGVHEGGGY